MKQAKSNKRRRRLGRCQRWLFPVVILLLASAMALTFSFLTGSSRIKLEEPVYQFYRDQKVEYGPGASLSHGTYNAMFEEDRERSNADATPVYSAAETKLILPRDMYWLDPSTGREWLVPGLSSLRMDGGGAVWCSNGRKEVRLEGGFLSDAAGTFLFLDAMTLRWNGRSDSVEPFSFYSVSTDGTLRVYRYGTQELIYEADLGEKDVGISVRGYQVDFTSGVYLGSDGTRRLLVSDPKLLTNLFQHTA